MLVLDRVDISMDRIPQDFSNQEKEKESLRVYGKLDGMERM